MDYQGDGHNEAAADIHRGLASHATGPAFAKGANMCDLVRVAAFAFALVIVFLAKTGLLFKMALH